MKKFFFLMFFFMSAMLHAENWTGTGWALKDGYVVTNFHCVDGATNIVVKSHQGDYSAKVVTTDESSDLAIIRINDAAFSGFGEVPYSIERKQCEVGESIWTIGYPMMDIMGEEVKFTDGKISAKTGYKGDLSTYQITVPIQPGNSGGPLFNESGNIVGITSSGLNKQVADNVNYAIKTSYLLNLIESALSLDIIPNGTTVKDKVLTEQIQLNKKFVFQLHFNDEQNGGIVSGNNIKKQPKEETIYYDKNGYGVASPSFASYYKVTLESGDPQVPNRYREFAMNGTLIAEGNFISIDKHNDKNSIYDGQCYDYSQGKVGLLFKKGELIKISVYDNLNSDILRYDIELTHGRIPNGYENTYDETGKIVKSIFYDNGVKLSEIINGVKYKYTAQGASNTIKVSTTSKFARITDNILHFSEERSYYSTRFLLTKYNENKATNCQEICLYNNSDKAIKIGIQNIYAVHCRIDNLFILPINLAWSGDLIPEIAFCKMEGELEYLSREIANRAKNNATVVTRTKGGSTQYTRYNDGRPFSIFGFGDSKDFIRTNSSSSSTSTTLDNRLYFELLEQGEDEYNQAVLQMQEEYEKFNSIIVDTIVLQPYESVNKIISYVTSFEKSYYRDHALLKNYIDPLFVDSHKIFLMYDIVDLDEDTLITSVNELYEVDNNKLLLEYSEYNNNTFVDNSYYCKTNSKDYYAVLRSPHFAKSNLYFKKLYDFDEKVINRNKKAAKKDPESEQAKKEKHANQMKNIQERLRSVIE